MQYVVHRRFRGKCLSGFVNLPYGTLCEVNGEVIYQNGKPIAVTTSENAHQYFARNDDGKGLARGQLTQQIQSLLRFPIHSYTEKNLDKGYLERRRKEIDDAWNRIWNDPKLKPYKMREFDDYWLWNHAFFNAEIEVLQYIVKVIEGGKSCIELSKQMVRSWV